MSAPQRVCRLSFRSTVTDLSTSPPRRIVVTAAVIEQNGMFLVTRRPRGVHLEGLWEFPGGKCEEGETHVASLEREIDEELNTGVVVHHEVFSVAHAYPDRVVELHFFACGLTGPPRAALGQEMRWVSREELRSLPFPPADEELIRRLTQEGER
jgi:8-oxo-dGTP diphosphatase